VVRRLEIDRYYDEPYGPGLHVVLLYRQDDLAEEAIEALELVAERLHDPGARYWAARITDEDDAVAVQACRFPQYRVLRDGSELCAIVGCCEAVDLLNRVQEALP